jgi:hypothetical protein
VSGRNNDFCRSSDKPSIGQGGAKVRRLISLTTLLVIMSISVGHAAEPAQFHWGKEKFQTKTFAITGKELLEISIPQSWENDVKPGGDDTKEIILGKPTGRTFLINLQVKGNNGPEFDYPEFVSTYLNQLKKSMKGKEPEASVNIMSISGADSQGLFYSMRIPQLEGTTIRYLTRGASRTGRLLLTFTILTEDQNSDYLKTALEVIRTARYRSE